MKPQLKSSPAARELIQRFEPFHDVAAQGSDGRWRVGFGHRAAAHEGVRVSRDDAALLLIYDVMQAEAVIDEIFPAPLPKPQRDALTSFVHDIGAAAFKNSDVARYMFEGRIEAAAEALAGYGEGNPDRREAESQLLLSNAGNATGAVAPARRATLVDLVIKVEHPEDAPVVQAAATVAPVRPALPDSIMPPPPPPLMSRQAIARREAESEIARILASVGAMPQDIIAPEDEVVSPDEPVEGIEEAAADMESVESGEPIETVEVQDEAVEAETAPVPDAPDLDTPDIDVPVLDAPMAEDAAQDIETEHPGDSADVPVANAPADEEPSAGEASPAEPLSAQVMARMSQEIAQVHAGSDEAAESEETTSTSADALPAGISLGYAFTGSALTLPDAEPETEEEAVLEPAAEPADQIDVEPEAGPEIEAAQELETEPAAPELEVEPAEPEIDEVSVDAAASPETAEPDAPDAGIVVEAASIVVERTLAVNGDHTPPPHPADAPASSAGAVGDIAGEAPDAAHDIEPTDDFAAAIAELEGEDGFAPHDLVGTADAFVDAKPAAPRKEEDGWGFVATLIAGLVVAGAGVLDIYGDWPRVWVERDPTWGVLAAIAGSFLVVTATWMLWSVLAAKRRLKRDN